MRKTQAQHKPPSEESSRNKVLSELRRENHQLKRQLAKARKQLVKVIETQTAAETVREEVEAAPEVKPAAGPFCEGCYSPSVSLVKVPGGTLFGCRECNHRKIVRK